MGSSTRPRPVSTNCRPYIHRAWGPQYQAFRFLQAGSPYLGVPSITGMSGTVRQVLVRPKPQSQSFCSPRPPFVHQQHNNHIRIHPSVPPRRSRSDLTATLLFVLFPALAAKNTRSGHTARGASASVTLLFSPPLPRSHPVPHQKPPLLFPYLPANLPSAPPPFLSYLPTSLPFFFLPLARQSDISPLSWQKGKCERCG